MLGVLLRNSSILAATGLGAGDWDDNLGLVEKQQTQCDGSSFVAAWIVATVRATGFEKRAHVNCVIKISLVLVWLPRALDQGVMGL